VNERSNMTQQGLAGTSRGGVHPRFGSLPNILTYGRILAIPALVACSLFVTGDWGRWAAMWIFIAAGVSDFLDGYFARA
jgi:cardiolipin synthase (CMP-forming)